MVRKHRKNQKLRPQENLPSKQLKRAWERYLRSQMDRQQSTKARSRYEILMTPGQLEFYAEKVPQDWMRLPLSPRMQLFVEALQLSLPKLPLVQRLVVKNYYGLEGREAKGQEELAAKLGLRNQVSVFRYLERGKKHLKSLISTEIKRLIKERLNDAAESDELD